MPLPTHTHAVSLADTPQWHQGIRYYAIWCLLVDDPQWLGFIAQAQRQLGDLLHPGYQRQPHITLSAAGLVDERFCRRTLLNQQSALLEHSLNTPLTLKATELSSFATAPWIGVAEPNNQLHILRDQLNRIATEESPPAHYQPHLTLGFYRHSGPIERVIERLHPLQKQACELPALTLDTLHLCYYETRQVQGALTPQQSVPLCAG